MHQLPAQLYLDLLREETDRHLVQLERRHVAQARERVEQDREALLRAWKALHDALQAESRSRRELIALTQ